MIDKYVVPILMTAAGVIVGMIVYDMFVKGAVGNYEGSYELDERTGDYMKVA